MKSSSTNKSTFFSFYIIFIASLFLFYKYILQISPSIMSHQLEQEFSLHATSLGNLAAAYFYSYVIMQLFAGPLIDRYSPGKVAGLAVLSCAAGAFVFANAHFFCAAFGARVLMGIGVAFATVCYMKMASIYCKPQYYAFVSGLLVTAAMAGAIFGETPLVILMQYTGWRGLLIAAGIFGLLLSLVFFVFVKKPEQNQVLEPTKKIEWRSLKLVFTSSQNGY